MQMKNNAKRIGMWSGPRNISTALMRSFENRVDTTVVDEPFYAYFLNETGIKHPIYKNKAKIFNTPAFNFDEVVTLPQNSTLLSSNSINKVMATNFQVGDCEIWGIQYHPEITYKKMVSLIHFRKDRLLNNKAFKDEIDINEHVKIIENEDKITKKDARMRELENWLNYIDVH